MFMYVWAYLDILKSERFYMVAYGRSGNQRFNPVSVKLMYPSPAVRDKGAPFQKINDSTPSVWI